MNVGEGTFVHVSGKRWLLDFVASGLRAGRLAVVFDVGANQGGYSAEVVARLGDRAVVYAFEPSRAAFALLRERVGESGSVRIFNFGFSDEEGVVYLRDFFELLQPRYFLFSLLADGLASIEPYRESCELFQTANCVAIRRGAAVASAVARPETTA